MRATILAFARVFVCVCVCVSNARWVYPVWLFINKHRGSLSFRHSFRLFRLHSFSSEFCIFIAVVYRRSINESATFVWRCFLFFSFFFLSLAEKLERRIWFWKRWKDLQDSIIYWVNESLGRSKQQWIYFHILEIDRWYAVSIFIHGIRRVYFAQWILL